LDLCKNRLYDCHTAEESIDWSDTTASLELPERDRLEGSTDDGGEQDRVDSGTL
jgi:hypothetical protein